MSLSALKGYSIQTAGSNPGTWGAGASTALNEGVIEIIDTNMAGVLPLSLTNLDITLTADQAKNCLIRLTGTLTGNVTITNPNNGFYFVENLTGGSFSVTLTNGVAGFVVPAARVPVFADVGSGVQIMLPPTTSTVTPDLSNVNKVITADYTIVPGDIRQTLVCVSGNCDTITIPSLLGFPSTFAIRISNIDSRAKKIAVTGTGTFFLWPGQTTALNYANGSPGFNPSIAGIAYRPIGSVTIYVDPVNGNDNNDGLARGLNGAKLTIGAAVTQAKGYDSQLSGAVTVQLAAGTYNVGSGVSLAGTVYGGNADQVFIQGDDSNPSAYVIQCDGGAGNACFFARDQAIVTISGMKLRTLGNGATALSCSQGAVLDVEGNIIFDAFPLGTHMACVTWASINVLTNYTVIGDVTIHIGCSTGGYINYGSLRCTIPNTILNEGSGGTPGFWVTCGQCGNVNAGGVPMQFTGATNVVGGHQYAVASNGVIALGSPPAVYPGTGTQTGTGGQVVN